MSITYAFGDILDWADKVDVIGHQVNCFGIMGGGLALQIAKEWPKVESDYRKYVERISRDVLVNEGELRRNLLGVCQIVATDKCSIANLFGQYDVGLGRRTDYDALFKSLKALKKQMIDCGKRKLALPVNLGCGLAGGDWSIVQEIIEKIFKDIQIELLLVSYS